MRLVDGHDVTPPPELRLYWMSQRYGALPEPGGLLEQDAMLLERMTTLGTVYESVSHMRSLKGPEIHNMSPAAGRVIMWLEAQGIEV